MRRNADAVLAVNAPQATLVEKLEAAFGGDRGARIFLPAALRSARRSTLPNSPAALLDFVRAHLIDVIAEELGPRAVGVFLAEVSEALRFVSGVDIRDEEADLVVEDLGLHDPLPGPIALPAAFQALAPGADLVEPTTAKGRARVPALLIHGDRFIRASLARQLLGGGWDVTVVETLVDVATIPDDLPDVAVVDLAADDVELLLEAIVRRNPAVRILALAEAGPDVVAVLERVHVGTYEAAPPGTRGLHLVELVRQLADR